MTHCRKPLIARHFGLSVQHHAFTVAANSFSNRIFIPGEMPCNPQPIHINIDDVFEFACKKKSDSPNCRCRYSAGLLHSMNSI